MPELGLRGLEDGTIEIGWLPLDEGAVDTLELLDPAERERAGRMRAPGARAAFVQTRVALRRALARLLERPPAAVPISLDANGKPRLTADAGLPDLRFSVAHTRGLALCALALDRELGVDVEWRGRDLPWQDMAATAFSLAEQEALAALPEDARRPGFYAGWTRKEAWLKGLGTGFSAATAANVPMDPRALTALRLIAPSGSDWSLRDLAVPGRSSDYAAALACSGDLPALRWLDFSAAPNRSGA